MFIDDFAISRYSEEGIKILYHLIKLRDDLGTSTLFTCQYSPDEWGNQLSDEKECYGKLDGIRRRLTTGFTVLIEKAQPSVTTTINTDQQGGAPLALPISKADRLIWP